ncbi:NTP pyrophosphohydrolase-like domain [Vibrio phage 1.198.B._10N.286.54.F4]|nr:NTP pyrophosphohydrolase-like domain [Vibrio phage 1.198.A._10N.286.54.F4]AUR94834.1 NTP pyrophosphohydrolase-like domain [Vibrio phage 1.198.B._10N.286.54.F4]
MSLEKTKQWFEQAIPEPTLEQATIQLGCHMEEFNEMMDSIGYSSITEEMEAVSDSFKMSYAHQVGAVENCDKEALLDALVDQIVTAVGVGHMMRMDVLGALEEINRSNFSKFEDGKPVFDANGKITKGKDYVKPNLEKFV